MINDENINRSIEEALNSINSIKRATPKPYLLTRINARLDKQVKSFWENAAQFISRPMVMLLSLCLIIALNISVILVKSNSSKNNTIADRSITTTTDEDEYSATFATIDNIENP